MNAVLSVIDAHKRFGDTQALAGAGLELHAGEWLALLGPNGAGKTTLVRALAGRVRLDHGRLDLLGRSLDGTPADDSTRARLGIVPQEIALYPQLTAVENLRAWARLHGVPPADLQSRVSWSLEWTGLGERAKEPVKQFSGGMKRRLNIACGVLHRPKVVLLDEPTVGVDPQSRERIWEMLEEIRRDGASLLLTTHQLDEAQQVCDRIAIIDHGKTIAAGTFNELVQQTIGAQRRITFSLAGEAPPDLPPKHWTTTGEGDIACSVEDIAAELPALLSELAAAGATVADLHVEAPTLQAVFIHLTGRELREMIKTLLGISWLNLKRDRIALGLTFVLPLVFFSIFSLIFGSMGASSVGAGSIKIIGVDLDGTEVSAKFIDALDGQDAIEIVYAPQPTDEDPDPQPFTRDSALQAVRTGERSAALVVPKGFGDGFGSFGGDAPAVELIHDPSNPLVEGIVTGLIQASAMSAAPDILLDGGIEQFETFGGALTPQQKTAIDEFKVMLNPQETDGAASAGEDEGDGAQAAPAFAGLIEVETTSAMENKEDDEGDGPSIVSYYAAGIGVMFLLFSMTGATSALLEEEESGTLERLLSSNVGMGTLLAGNWIFFAAVGFLQLCVMFIWGAVFFGLDLFTPKHLVGFVCMSLITAAAAAAFGLMLATIASSRAQLNGISTVVILVMSALGGSMIPRFAMPEFMNKTALFTFNGWALDGYLKVFWYGDPGASLLRSLLSLAPQLAVLGVMAIAFLAVSRFLAKRWETV